MNRKLKQGLKLGVIGAIALLICLGLMQMPILQAQTPRDPGPVEVPPLPPAPPTGEIPAPTPTLSPSPGTTPAPGATPTPGATPGANPDALPPAGLPPSLPPASTAPAATLEIKPYVDGDRRFQVGIVRGYKTTPLAGTVLVESPDGSLAYSVVAQAQPRIPVGLTPGFDADELVQVATTVFQRGENFQPGTARPEAGGGIVMNWTGSLTIGGKTQPVSGVILVRPNIRQILLVPIAATDAAKDQVPGVLAAVANSLEAPQGL
ncbi:MAG TPA: hypothetical protein IGS53_16140 [Leptolyngbyaceae cyanobacterium M33_DOE_097]|uniref:Uncharacterized protein n=1 Tax=Oscillatoriales cyanobacterium SpSt-418 TaxID=2282169 RepID=A0A7C3PHT6_9CYAN|nr:hypothetical protein [Leptolyngbyaceae cyanobacterium M33_DOE_097]